MHSSEFEKIRNIYQVFIKPGTIWRLPVSYSLNYLPETIWSNENGEVLRETDKRILHRYWHLDEKSFFYKSIYSETVNTVEVRPFLVVSDYTKLQEISKLSLPGWYSNSIIGFPISKAENLRKRQDIGFNPEEAFWKKNNHFLHFIASSKENGLDTDSYLSMSTITFLDKAFFTEKIGSLGEEYETIIKKFKSFHSIRD